MNLITADGNWLLHRCWHAVGKYSNAPEKRVPNQLLDWFCQAALKLQCKGGALCFDGHKVFRYKIWPDYKANRKQGNEGDSDRVNALIEPTRELFAKHGLLTLQHRMYEADDLLRSSAWRFTRGEQNNKVWLFAKDKDMVQAVTDKVNIYTPAVGKSPEIIITPHSFKKAKGMTPKQFLEYQILCGDKIDNVPNIPDIGTPAAAKKLLLEHGSLAAYFETKAGAKMGRRHEAALMRNRALVTLRKDAWPEEADELMLFTQVRGDNQYAAGLTALKSQLSKRSLFG